MEKIMILHSTRLCPGAIASPDGLEQCHKSQSSLPFRVRQTVVTMVVGWTCITNARPLGKRRKDTHYVLPLRRALLKFFFYFPTPERHSFFTLQWIAMITKNYGITVHREQVRLWLGAPHRSFCSCTLILGVKLRLLRCISRGSVESWPFEALQVYSHVLGQVHGKKESSSCCRIHLQFQFFLFIDGLEFG